MHIIDPPAAAIPADLPTGLTAKQALGASRASISAVKGVLYSALPAYLIFFGLQRLFEWLGWTMPGYILAILMLLLIGLGLAEERSRRADRHRTRASMAVRSYVSGVSMAMTKASHDLLRQLKQELRDAYTTRSEQRQRAITGTRNSAQRTLAELEQSPAVLAEIGASRALLAGLHARAAAIVPAQLLAAGTTTG